MLRVAYNAASVTVHGITRDAAVGGMNEAEALELFLDYLRDGVIVGHHIGHDIQALNCALERHFRLTLQNRLLDTMDLTLHLKDDGAFVDQSCRKASPWMVYARCSALLPMTATRRVEMPFSLPEFSCVCCAQQEP